MRAFLAGTDIRLGGPRSSRRVPPSCQPSGVGLEAQCLIVESLQVPSPPHLPTYLLHRFPPLKSSQERTGGPGGPLTITIPISSLQQDPGLGTCLSPSPAVGLPVPPVLQPWGLACFSCSHCLLRRCGLCMVNNCSEEVEMVPKSAAVWLLAPDGAHL